MPKNRAGGGGGGGGGGGVDWGNSCDTGMRVRLEASI